jgi:hypothetical protein
MLPARALVWAVIMVAIAVAMPEVEVEVKEDKWTMRLPRL